jgi:hypothetical protein
MSTDKKYEPIVFQITDQEDLKQINEFKEQHKKSCRETHPDSLGALFTYKAIPTGLGTLYFVECACGEEITLKGDFDF